MREQLRAAHSRSYREFLEYRFYGAEGQNRTVDTSLFRAVLYQLSYLGISVGCVEGFLSTGSPRKNQLSMFGVAERAGFEPATGF